MNYVIYCRKSSESELKQVRSIEAQERELLEHANRRGFKVVKIFKESQSAKDAGRPVFAEMIRFIQKGNAKGIIAWKLDRLARNFTDSGQIMDLLGDSTILKVSTIERDYNPGDNVLMPSVEFGMATQFSKDLSINVKRGNRQKLEKGEWPNHAPMGYLNDKATKTIKIDPEKEYYIRRTFELYITGTHSTIDIANILYAEGLRSSSGKKVYKGKIHMIIHNPFYMGMMERGGKYYPGNHTPIISSEIFEQAKEVALYGLRPRMRKHFFPLRGFLKCGECGCAITATSKKGHDYYYCTNGKEQCNEHKTYMRESYLYPLIESIFDELHFDEELIEIMYKAAKERLATKTADTNSILLTLQKSLESLKAKESRLLDTYTEGQIPKALYDEKILEVQNQRTVTLAQIQQQGQKSYAPEITLEPVKKIFLDSSRAKKEFSEADIFLKHKLLEKLLWNLTIKDNKIVSYQFKMPFSVLAKTPKTGAFTTLLRD